MTELEMAIVIFINELHRKDSYTYDKYQLLHNVKYKKEMDLQYIKFFREKYKNNCLEAAYELKTYYMENNIFSNTIVLKMRPKSPESQELPTIKIHSEIENVDYEYTHHAIEIFKEHGKYKVFDVLHSDKVIWLDNYLDAVCSTNHCPREQLRYDMGYLAPCHASAGNMQGLSDVMRYLDKKYCIGKPRFNFMNISDDKEEGLYLSDDIFMDFDLFGREFGVDRERLSKIWARVYGKLVALRFNMLHQLCLVHIMREPILSMTMAEALFDDVKICKIMDETSEI